MYQGNSVAVVVPAYNEEGFVGDVIDAMPEFVDRVYAVDDCSTDGTWAEIRDRGHRADTRATTETDGGRRPPAVVPIRHETNRGVGGAIKTGYRRAVVDGMDVTAVVSGDGQMDPGILERFVDPIVSGDADFTKGNRLRSRDHRAQMSGWRLFGNTLLSFLTKVASGYWKMMDPQNGYTAISLEALETIDVDRLSDRYGFINDLLVELNTHGFRLADVPMAAVYGDEESDIAYTTFVPVLSSLLFAGFLRRLRVRYLVTDFHPLVFLYALGTVGGLLTVVYAVLTVLAGGGVVAVGVGALLLGGSATLVVLAMVFDTHENEDLEYDAAR